MRIYELSKQLNVPVKQLLEVLKSEGVVVKSHMSIVDEKIVALLRKKFEKVSEDKSAKGNQEQKESMQKEHVKRQSIPAKQSQKQAPQASVSLPNQPKIEPKEEPREQKAVVIKPMIVSDAAAAMEKPVHDLILTLLKWKIIAAKNKLLSEDVVERLVRHYELIPLKKEKEVAVKEELSRIHSGVSTGELKERLPVIVVLGHVDHGKQHYLILFVKHGLLPKKKVE